MDGARQASGNAARGRRPAFPQSVQSRQAQGEISPLRQGHLMALAIALILLVVGTVLFHFVSPWWFTPIASNWKMMDDTVNITFVVTGIVFVAINLFMAFALFLYRHRQGRRAEYAP